MLGAALTSWVGMIVWATAVFGMLRVTIVHTMVLSSDLREEPPTMLVVFAEEDLLILSPKATHSRPLDAVTYQVIGGIWMATAG
jgi:hypothetical protein